MLFIARHGETDWNAERRFQARSDVPLNAKGRAQAVALGALFRRCGVRFALARSSPLSRALETARIILADQSVPLTVEPAFVELSVGDFEGRLESELRAELGVAYDDWRAGNFTVAAPGGEDLETAVSRVAPALDALRGGATTGDVLIVAHQAVNMAIKVALAGRLDATAVAGYRQGNDQVDVWDVTSGRAVERLQAG